MATIQKRKIKKTDDNVETYQNVKKNPSNGQIKMFTIIEKNENKK